MLGSPAAASLSAFKKHSFRLQNCLVNNHCQTVFHQVAQVDLFVSWDPL